jgi:hypothetical protein
MTFAVGDVWRDSIGTRTILAVYDRDLLIIYEFDGGRSMLTLPKRLFVEGRCGSKV